MKYVKYFLTFFIGMFYLGGVAFAEESKFEPTINANYEDTSINIVLGYKGEVVNNISQKIAYDSRHFIFEGINSLEEFGIVEKKESKSGKWNIIEVKFASSSYSLDSDYALLSLKAKDYKGGDVFFYEYEASSFVDKYRYHHAGYVMKIKDAKRELTHVLKLITKKTKREYFFDSIKWYLLASILIVLGLFILILLKPSKRIKENKKDKLNTKIKYSKNVIVGKEKIKKEDEKEEVEVLEDFKIVDNKVEGLGRINPLFDKEDEK